MASTLMRHDMLDALDREIDMLDARLLEEEREAHGIVVADGQDERTYEILEARSFRTRMMLGQKLREHRRIAREILSERCPIHGAGNVSHCGDCRRAA